MSQTDKIGQRPGMAPLPQADDAVRAPSVPEGHARVSPGEAPAGGISEPRMQAMRAAVRRSGGVLLLDRFCVDARQLQRRDAPRKEARAVKQVEKGLKELRQAFDRLDKINPAALEKIPMDRKTSGAVNLVFKQLDALDRQLGALEAITGATPVTSALRDAAMARMCEMSRLVGALQAEGMARTRGQTEAIPGFTPLPPGGGIREMLGRLALTMHGNDPFTQEISALAESLFNDLKALKEKDTSDPGYDSVREAAALRARATAIKEKVDGILDAHATGSAPGEPALFQAIGEYVDTALHNMDVLIAEKPREIAVLLARQAFPPVALSPLEACGRLPEFMKKFLAEFQTDVNGRNKSLLDMAEAGTLTGAAMRKKLDDRQKGASSESTRLAKAYLQAMDNILSGEFKAATRGYARTSGGSNALPRQARNARHAIALTLDPACVEKIRVQRGKTDGVTPSSAYLDMADELLRTFLPLAASPDEAEPYRTLYNTFMKPTMLGWDGIAYRNALEAADAVALAEKTIPMERYIPLLFEDKAKVSTVVNAAMYGIAPEHLETRPDSRTPLKMETLGQGFTNTVRLCQYSDEFGAPLDLVFKPEAPARAGFEDMRMGTLGYADAIRAARLNMASSTVANLMGSAGVLASTALGFLEGEFGLFMSRAPGMTPRDMQTSGMMQEMLYAVQNTGQEDVMFANLQRQLCQLEWIDLLCGQVDRHHKNYLVDVNPENGSVIVTGIDNDGSFGAHMIGIGTADISSMNTPQQLIFKEFIKDHQDTKLYEVVDGKLLLHFDRAASPEEYQHVRNMLGVNQAFLPAHIDGETYTRLMAMEPDAYRDSLRPFLPDEALDAAVSRLKSAQDYAQSMVQADKTRTGPKFLLEGDAWQDKDLRVEARRERGKERYEDKGTIGKEFFVRDFGIIL